MDPTNKTFTSEDSRKWIGRIIMAVILGEAIWNLIVSVMNNLVVPWLGDLFGQSSGLPTSFTQRPYNYPDLFVSILEFCIAALVAAIINYFFQRPRTVRVKTVKTMKTAAPIAPVEPLRIVPEVSAPAAIPQTAPGQSPMPQIAMPQPAPTQPAVARTAPPVAPPPPVTKPVPIAAPAVTLAPVTPAPPVVPPTVVAPVPVAKLAAVAPAAPSVPVSAAKPQSPPKPRPSKPTKTKEIYYNIVGEPMPSDDE